MEPFLSRVKWKNIARLMAVSGAGLLLVFGARLGDIFKEPELPEKAGLPVEQVPLRSGNRPGVNRPSIKAKSFHQATFVQSAELFTQHKRSVRVKRKSSGKHGAKENHDSQMRGQVSPQYQSYSTDKAPPPNYPPSHTQEFTPG